MWKYLSVKIIIEMYRVSLPTMSHVQCTVVYCNTYRNLKTLCPNG